MISGAHVLIYSKQAAADAKFFGEVLELHSVDAGEGFLIFGLPPAELAMHETDADASAGKSELHLIVDDVAAFIAKMAERGVACEPVAERGWGTVTSVALPSGIKVGVYEAHHARPHAGGVVKAAVHAAKQAKKAAKALEESAKAVRHAAKAAVKRAKHDRHDKKADKKADKKVDKAAKKVGGGKADRKAEKSAKKQAKQAAKAQKHAAKEAAKLERGDKPA